MRRESGEWLYNLRIWAYRESWPRAAAGRAPLPHTGCLPLSSGAAGSLSRVCQHVQSARINTRRFRVATPLPWLPVLPLIHRHPPYIRESTDKRLESSVRSDQLRINPSYQDHSGYTGQFGVNFGVVSIWY